MEKLAIKRLSASDLTFFACHFNPKHGTNQKAWNLDKKVFVEEMYPVHWGDSKHNVTLAFHGPDNSPKHVLERKIVRQQKNMRLNGELIHGHDSGTDSYDLLAKGDYALMVFKGAPFPDHIDIFLIAQASRSDCSLHNEITTQVGDKFNQLRSMVQLNKEEVQALLDSSSVGDYYPVRSLFDDELLEDVVQGGVDGFKKLRKRRRGEPVSSNELAQAKAKAAEIGSLGERLVNEYLSELERSGQIEGYVWESAKDAIAPYDFELQHKLGSTVLDVKSTSSAFNTKLHISVAELLEARDGGKRYDIYRVFEATDNGAKMRIAEDFGAKASEIITALEALPHGISCDSVSISPETLTFGDEFQLEG